MPLEALLINKNRTDSASDGIDFNLKLIWVRLVSILLKRRKFTASNYFPREKLLHSIFSRGRIFIEGKLLYDTGVLTKLIDIPFEGVFGN